MTGYRPLYVPTPYQEAADHGRLILRDGSTAQLRRATHADVPLVARFYRKLSPHSRWMRFFSEAKPHESAIRDLCDGSTPDRLTTLLVLRQAPDGPRVIATGSWIRVNDTTAEFAVAVDDAYHGKGIGGILLERLAILAVGRGCLTFLAITHPSNQAMLDVFRHSGFEMTESMDEGLVNIELNVTPRAESVAHADTRDRVFTKASIRPFFNPRGIAVVGASRDPSSLGHRLLESLVRRGFAGAIFPVNPNARVVFSIKAYPRLEDIPDPVDLAILAVPKDLVPDLVSDCAAKGVKALIVITSGYAEVGPEGAALQQNLLDQVRGYGMRLLGPNALGLINTDPDVRLHASFAPVHPLPGRIALSSQSGALGLALLNLARQRGLGLSMFVSMGNKADVTGNDLLYYWEDDPKVEVILLYLESFGNPRRFARIAREVARHKPIVCVKSGRVRAGTRTSRNLEDATVSALFQQIGVIRADTLEEMFEIAALLGNQPLPQGNRVAILTNSRGAGVLCADACDTEALTPVSVSDFTDKKKSRSGETSFLDLTANALPAEYTTALFDAVTHDAVHAAIVLYIPVDQDQSAEVIQAISVGLASARKRGGSGKPVLLVMITGDATEGVVAVEGETLPRYAFPETAVRALGHAVDYGAWRSRPPGVIPFLENIDLPAARRWMTEHAGKSSSPDEITEFFGCFGITVEPAPASVKGDVFSLRIRQDSVFGPVIELAALVSSIGAAAAPAYRVTPLTLSDAESMVRDVLGLDDEDLPGFSARLIDLLLRISLMAHNLANLLHLELPRITSAGALLYLDPPQVELIRDSTSRVSS